MGSKFLRIMNFFPDDIKKEKNQGRLHDNFGVFADKVLYHKYGKRCKNMFSNKTSSRLRT